MGNDKGDDIWTVIVAEAGAGADMVLKAAEAAWGTCALTLAVAAAERQNTTPEWEVLWERVHALILVPGGPAGSGGGGACGPPAGRRRRCGQSGRGGLPAYYAADQERIQRSGKLFGPRIAQAAGDPVSHWWAEEYTRRIGWLAADTLNKKAKAASAAAEKQAAEAETAARHEDIFRLITRMNQRYSCPRQEEDPKFAKLKEEVKNALNNTAEGSPEREALLSAYQRMLHLPTHPEDASPEKSRKGRDDLDEILRIFK